jgi:DNA-directed RNA polymerase subunit RPC12/RpoP
MNKHTAKCYRCGKELPVDKARRVITCPHCHAQMTYDVKTEKILKYLRWTFVLIVTFLILLSLGNLDSLSGILVALAAMAFSAAAAMFADDICIWILTHTVGAHFQPYIKEKERKTKKAPAKKGTSRQWILRKG